MATAALRPVPMLLYTSPTFSASSWLAGDASKSSSKRLPKGRAVAVSFRRCHRGGSSRVGVVASAGSTEEVDAVVIGAGLAGLCCARTLTRAGKSVAVLEASDGVGGRCRTDEHEGFLLDRGFHIFSTGYAEAQKVLDYEALDFRRFYAGALVRFDNSFHRVADPFRHVVDGVFSLPNAVGSVLDKLLVGLVRFSTLAESEEAIYTKPESTIEERLRKIGFSEAMIDRFFRPFFGGIFFDNKLRTSSRQVVSNKTPLVMFYSVFRTLALGDNCLPAKGIGEIPAQIARSLPSGTVRLNNRVQSVAADALAVTLANGQSVRARDGIVVAADGPAAAKLLGSALAASPSTEGDPVGTICLYFVTTRPPRSENILYLNGEGRGIVNNMCFPSCVASSYAPPGKTLVSVSLVGTYPSKSDQELQDTVLAEVAAWFGESEVSTWRHLCTYRIPFAQPNQSPPTNFRRPVRLSRGLYVCGDHRDPATFDAAMVSGRRAAEALLEDAGVTVSGFKEAAQVSL
eukprot:jgi/Chlat1/456/Chrsp103S00974